MPDELGVRANCRVIIQLAAVGGGRKGCNEEMTPSRVFREVLKGSLCVSDRQTDRQAQADRNKVFSLAKCIRTYVQCFR